MHEAISASTYLTPSWAVLPFVGYLFLIAALPLFAGRLWEPNRNKLILAILAGIPAVVGLAGHPDGVLGQLFHTGCDYVAFMALLGSLFAISGGIRVRGALIGTPLVNIAFLAIGAALASIIGTTGASALLIRPLLAGERAPRAHDARGGLLHLHRRERGRPADAARRSAAVPRVPAGRPVRLDAAPRARLGAGERPPAGAVRRLRSGRARARTTQAPSPAALRSRAGGRPAQARRHHQPALAAGHRRRRVRERIARRAAGSISAAADAGAGGGDDAVRGPVVEDHAPRGPRGQPLLLGAHDRGRGDLPGRVRHDDPGAQLPGAARGVPRASRSRGSSSGRRARCRACSTTRRRT